MNLEVSWGVNLVSDDVTEASLGEIIVLFSADVVPNRVTLSFLKAPFLQRVLKDFQTELFR